MQEHREFLCVWYWWFEWGYWKGMSFCKTCLQYHYRGKWLWVPSTINHPNQTWNPAPSWAKVDHVIHIISVYLHPSILSADLRIYFKYLWLFRSVLSFLWPGNADRLSVVTRPCCQVNQGAHLPADLLRTLSRTLIPGIVRSKQSLPPPVSYYTSQPPG